MSNDFQLNDGNTGDDNLRLTALAGGGFVAVWDSSDPGIGDFGGVYYRVFDATGAALSPTRRAHTDTEWNQNGGNAVATPDGGFYIAWNSEGADNANPDPTGGPNDFDVFLRRFDALGNALGAQEQVTGPVAAGFDQFLQDIDLRADGGLRLVTVASNVRTDWTATTWRFDAAGDPQGPGRVIATELDTGLAAAFRLRTPGIDVVERADGTFLAAWWEQPRDAAGDPFAAGDQIRAQVFAADGTPLGPVQGVSPLLVLTGGVFPPDARFPDVAAVDGGRYAVAWTQEDGENFRDTDVYVALTNPLGSPLTAPIRVNPASDPQATGAQSLGDVVALPGIGFLVSYSSFARREGIADLYFAYARVFDESGDALTGQIQLGNFVYEDLSSLNTTLLQGGQLLAGWSWGDVSDEEIRGVIYDGGGTGAAGLVIATAPGTYTAAPGGGTVLGSPGADALLGQAGADALFGAAGDDLLAGLQGSDVLDGGAGTDTAAYANGAPPAGVVASLESETATDPWGNTDTLTEVENLSGTDFADSLTGGASVNVLQGLGGNDALFARGSGGDSLDGGDGDDTMWSTAAVDTLSGGAGNDTFRGQGGADTYIGGAGDDTFVVFDAGTVVVEAAGAGNDTAWALADGYTLAPNVETARLAGPALRLTGSAGGDTLVANQSLAGSALDGAGGNDTLWGTALGETLAGGAGDDTLYGGGGADVFAFDAPGWGFDLVSVFDRAAGAKIDLRGSGVASFDQLSVVSGANTQIAAPDGSVIYVFNANGFTAADFLFA